MRRPRFGRTAVLALFALLAVTFISPSSAQAATSCRNAVGRTFSGLATHPTPVYAGTWSCGGGPAGFCVEFSKRSPQQTGRAALRAAAPPTFDGRRLSSATTSRILHLASRYGSSTNRDTTAAAQFAIWKLIGNPAFTTYYGAARSRGIVSAAMDRAVVAMVAESAAHGPYRAQVSFPAAPAALGQTGQARIAVTRMVGGAPAAGVRVQVTMRNAAVVSGGSATTGASGVVLVSFRRVEAAPVEVRVTTSAAHAAVGSVTVTPTTNQRIVFGATAVGSASASYQRTVAPPTVRVACTDAGCDGGAAVTVSATNAAGAWPMLYRWRSGGRTVATLSVPAGTSRSATVAVPDGAVLTAEGCATGSVGGACVTALRPVQAADGTPWRQTVVCPARMQLTFSGSCPCDGGPEYRFTLHAPEQSPRFFRVVVDHLDARGASIDSRTYDLAAGDDVPTAAMRPGPGDRVVVRYSVHAERIESATGYVYGPELARRELVNMVNGAAA